MTNKRKLLGAAAFSVALAGGGVAGALLGTPGTSGAQDGTTSTTTAAAAAKSDHPGRPLVRHAVREAREARIDFIQTAAKALGTEPADLRAELRDGKSIADVAKEKGVDLQKVVDALVTEGTARLQDEITKLPDQMTKLVNREGIGHGGPPPDGPPPAADAPSS